MSYVIERPDAVCLPVTGTDRQFPVHLLYCVGRNYADHAVEMGSDPDREPPFFFMKPDYAVLPGNEDMLYPALSEEVHHEIELVVALKAGGRDVSPSDAMDLVFGYAVGIDMTRRDLQAEAKASGRPWEAGKAFLHAAPCSMLTPLAERGEISSAEISLRVNGEPRQQGNVNQMIWKVPDIISRLSTLFHLCPGDLIFTGTPAGVGPVLPGDRIEGHIDGLSPLSFSIRSA